MSRILKNRKFWLLAAVMVIIVVFLGLKVWVAAAVVGLCEILLLLDFWVARETQKPLSEFYSNRKIRQVDTLIIGDWCSRRVLAEKFDLSRSLLVLAPERSVKASILLLEHLASRLDGKKVCIVAPHDDNGIIGPYETSYLSQLTKLELGLENNSYKRLSFLFEHPVAFLHLLMSPFVTLKEVKCWDDELVKYCERKGFELVFIKKQFAFFNHCNIYGKNVFGT